MPDTVAEFVINCEASLREATDRSNFESQWRRISQLMLPDEGNFLDIIAPGVERHRRLLDSTAPRSLELFASFLLNSLSNPNTQWLKETALDEAGNVMVNPSNSVKQYTELKEKIKLRELGRPGVGFYTALHTSFLTAGAFGTDVMYVDRVQDKMLFEYVALRDVVIDEDMHGTVDTVIRQRKTTARKAAKRWRSYFEENYDLSKKEEEEVKIFHYVAASTPELIAKLPESSSFFPFVSVWVDEGKGKTIFAGGFNTMPYIVSRWYKGADESPYGRSQGMTVLPDVRMVNSMKETLIRASEKLADMPILLREGALLSPVRSFAGGITFTDGDVKAEPLLPPGSANPQIADQIIRATQEAIREGFFTPLFVTPEAPVKTATQVLQEGDERNRAVAPMLIRQHHERYHKLLLRVEDLLQTAGKLPRAPSGVSGTEPEFLSPIVASQRQTDALGTQRYLEGLGLAAQFDQNAIDNFDADRASLVIHAGSGAPASVLTTKAERDSRRKQRAESQQAAEDQASSLAAAEVGAKLTTAAAK